MNHKTTFPLPEELSSVWSISNIIYFNNKSMICQVQNTKTKLDFILKIYNDDTFSKRKYHNLSKLSDKYFILPKESVHLHHKRYLFYPVAESLKDILYQDGLSFHDILCLGIHMIDAVSCLCDQGILEADISPGNIYRSPKGIFCLGDINLESCTILGTPPFIAPEYHSKTSDPEVFQASMQFSICSLLHALCRLQKNFLFEEMQNILSRGMAEDPQDRYTSLESFKHALSTLSSCEINHATNRLLLHRENHPLFHTKTLPVPKSGHSILGYFIGISFMISVILFIFCLHRYNTFVVSTAKADNYISVIEASPRSSDEFYTPLPTETESINNASGTSELNLQDQNHNSFTQAVRNISSPSGILCIYAGNNLFPDLKGIEDFTRLKEFYGNNDQIKDISDIGKCAHLKTLILSYNNIEDISAISKLTNLEHLDLSSNKRLSDLDPLYRLHSLKVLNISDTNVSQKEYRQLTQKLPACQIIY